MEQLLINNSASMKTVVETYIIEETQELIYDNEQLAKWNNLVNELGLTGQTNVVKEDKSPIPFLWMNKGLVKVFEELCPRKTKIAEYNKTPIPVEALEMVAMATRDKHFGKIEVWYNDQSPDPAIIGYKYNGGKGDWEREWSADRYLLARWSDVKATLEELTERAKKLFTLRRTDELNKNIKNCQRQLDDIQIEVNETFGFGGSNESAVGLPF